MDDEINDSGDTNNITEKSDQDTTPPEEETKKERKEKPVVQVV